MSTEKHPATSTDGLLRVAGIAVLVGLMLAGIWGVKAYMTHKQESQAFWRAVAADDRVHAETRAFAAELAETAAGGLEADVLGAFANCYGALAAPRDDADIDRCEVQATQLAAARGHDARSANAVIQDARTRLDVYAAELKAPHDAATAARGPDRG